MGDSRDVTRRTLLGGLAAAGAASLLHPAAGLAGSRARAAALSSRWVGSLFGQSQPIAAPGVFSLVGIEWSGPAGAAIELRAMTLDGRWSAWVSAASLGHDGDRPRADGTLFGEPLWTGKAERVQLRTNRPVVGLRLHFVAAAEHPEARAAAAPPRALPVLDAGSGQPYIIARQGWGAGQAAPVHVPEYGTVKLAFVHHTVNPNGYSAAAVPSMLLAIFDYHVHVRGFWDIAYNFLIDSYGRIWEGRAGGIDQAVIGAHAGAYNAQSTGVAVLGDFTDVVPSPAAIDALQRLLAWKLSLHGVPGSGRVTVVVDPADAFYTPFAPGARVSLPRVAGHRDGDSTDCPGNAFYARLPAVRPRIVSLAGRPARLTLAAPPATVTAGAPVTLAGILRLLGGAPIAGAPIELQQFRSRGTRERTIATATTGSDGSWSIPLAPLHNAAVRALHRPAPASVADWVQLAVAPAITLTVQSTVPLRVNGTITPAKPRVTVELYGSGSRRKPLVTKRVSGVGGRFSEVIAAPRPGLYTLVARHPADATNAAGASAPVQVTVP